MQQLSKQPAFELGHIVATPGALAALRKSGQQPGEFQAWTASRKEARIPRTVLLKLKTSEFKILTRSHTPNSPTSSCEELASIALSLRDRVSLNPGQRFRLLGVGLSNFRDPDDVSAQPALFK